MIAWCAARVVLAAAALACAGAVAAEPAVAAETVRLDARTQERLGIATTTLAPASRVHRSETWARILDPAALAAAISELQAATAAAAASQAEATRSERLHADDGNISAQRRDLAVAQAAADAARASIALARLRMDWGPGVAGLPHAARKALVEAALAGSRALVRIELPQQLPLDSGFGAAEVQPRRNSAPLPVAVLGTMAVADLRWQTRGLLGVVDDPQGLLAPGQVLGAYLLQPGPPASGVEVPRSALLRWRGQLWVYVQTGPEDFERRPLPAAEAYADGWFVAAGLIPGEKVVHAGVVSLLAREQQSGLGLR